jgi:signal transduction histidine kinase
VITALDAGSWLLAAGAVGSAVAASRARVNLREAVARAVHEVRGPLAAAQLGMHPDDPGGRLSPARVQAVELEIARAGLALADLSAVAVGRRLRGLATSPDPGSVEDVDLRSLAASSVEAWREFASAGGTTLEFQPGALPLPVRGEPLRLAQGLGNLLANAAEHGGGRVTVRCRDDRGWARVEVTDDGPGLSVPVGELLARAPRDGRPGRGRGLSIAAVAAAHGGRLAGAPSERGARLVLELPLADGAVERGRGDGVR